MVLASEHVHSVLEDRLVEQGVFVVLVGNLFLCDTFCCAFRFFDVFLIIKKDGVHFRAQAHNLRDRDARALVFHFPENLLVFLAVQWMVLWKITRVIVIQVLSHVFVDVICLDLK